MFELKGRQVEVPQIRHLIKITGKVFKKSANHCTAMHCTGVKEKSNLGNVLYKGNMHFNAFYCIAIYVMHFTALHYSHVMVYFAP